MPKKTRFPKGKAVLLLLVMLAGSALWIGGFDDYLTFEQLKKNRDSLRSYVKGHYLFSVIAFITTVISTAFFLPGAIAITLMGGFLFGMLWGTVYMLAGATVGATLAFLFARYLIGSWMQQRYEAYLQDFNREISQHGHYYLITFRLVPVLPFFLINYLAGITTMPLGKFMWATAAGMLPGTLVYNFAGQEMGNIESTDDIVSPRLIFALSLLALFALFPPLLRLWRRVKRRSG